MKSHLFNYHLPTYKVKIASKLASQTPAKENQVLLTNFFGTAKDRKLNKDDFRAPTSVEIRERDKTVVLNSVRLQSYISAAEDPTILFHYDKKGVKMTKPKIEKIRQVLVQSSRKMRDLLISGFGKYASIASDGVSIYNKKYLTSVCKGLIFDDENKTAKFDIVFMRLLEIVDGTSAGIEEMHNELKRVVESLDKEVAGMSLDNEQSGIKAHFMSEDTRSSFQVPDTAATEVETTELEYADAVNQEYETLLAGDDQIDDNDEALDQVFIVEFAHRGGVRLSRCMLRILS